MKKFLILFCLLLPLFAGAQTAKPLRVACVGNSITYGSGIVNRDENSYPAQLQAYLGAGFQVRNFGVSATTLLSRGDRPYINTAEYRASLDFQPDIVLIKLGTNDSKPQNRVFLDTDYLKDYRALLRSYDSLPTRPTVILMTPVKCFTDDNISDSVIGGRIVPLVRRLAYEDGRPVLNLYNLFGDRWDNVLMPDRIHPSSIGAGRLAGKIGGYILRTLQDTTAATYPAGLPAPSDTGHFHGYAQYDFTLPLSGKGNAACHLVLPRTYATGRPWVLRARFWGHEPQTDISLLENGFAIAYCDVADLYGSSGALRRWDRFYDRMTRAGFNEKVILEGMSRGGLPLFNWAARHPERVLCIYADAPVMDLKSWPAKSSPEDTRKMMEAYGFRSDKQLRKWRHNPIDHAGILADAGIPILNVAGDADEVVPVAENTEIFRERYAAAGGTCMEVIHKPGVGHHPHSLNDPEPIVRFILRAAGLYENPCTHPIPGNEYRSAAGWVPGSDWNAVARDITATLSRRAERLGDGGRLKLLLLGNSITQGFGGCRNLVTYKPGREAMDGTMGDSTLWESAGISGDRTQHLLWRMQNGNYNIVRPENIVITIGINNLIGGDRPEEVAEAIGMIADEAARLYPHSRIFLFGPLPSGVDNDAANRRLTDTVHRLLNERQGAFPAGVRYIDPTPWFVTPENGTLRPGLYSDDCIHLTPEGYRVWSDHIRTLIR